MGIINENVLIYSVTAVLCILVIYIYLRNVAKSSQKTCKKIEEAKLEGLYEPISLHPVIDTNSCIGTGACVAACPEKDILGLMNGKAITINASRCVGHGACFHACPTQAITLVIGTESRGVELPHIKPTFETNVDGIYIAGELGGMGLIRNAVEQGKQAVHDIALNISKNHKAEYDLLITGAGPAGISASLTAKKLGLNFLTLEQDTLGGTVFTFPRSKIVMTSAMDLPLYGKVKLTETSKSELLELWNKALGTNNITIRENTKVESITRSDDLFVVETITGEKITAATILLALGRRGTPRKLGVPGELQEKVAYRLLEPENVTGKNIVVVGGGDSAIEAAIMLVDQNVVSLSYRSASFSRIKPKNAEKIKTLGDSGKVSLYFNTEVAEIGVDTLTLKNSNSNEIFTLNNDLVYIFAGGELPTQFLIKAGITVDKKFGEAILTHKRKT